MTRALPALSSGKPTLLRRALASPPVMAALFACPTAALVFVTLIAGIALNRWRRTHDLSEADWVIAAGFGLIVVAAVAGIRLMSMKRGCLVLGRVACSYAIVFYNLAITPGGEVEAVDGFVLMLACLASYAVLGTRYAKGVMALIEASEGGKPAHWAGLPPASVVQRRRAWTRHRGSGQRT